MRQAVILALIVGALFFAAGAVMTALAIKYATKSALWDFVIWAGVAVMLCSSTTLVVFISSEWYGRPFLGPALLMNFGLCLLIGGIVWHFQPSQDQSVLAQGSPTPAPLAPLATGPANDFLELKCEAVEQFALPTDGKFYSLEAYATEDDGRVQFVQRWVSEFAARTGPHILPGANSTLQLCTITNYADFPVFNLRTIIKVDFLNTQSGNGGMSGAGIRFSRNVEMTVQKIEARGTVSFYASADSPLIVWVNLPQTIEIQRLGSAARESVRFIRIDPAQFTLTRKYWLAK